MTEPTKLIIAFGTNIDQEANMRIAERLVRRLFPEIDFTRPMWTDPIDIDSDKYLNRLACTYTRHDLPQIERALKQIEHKCGRSRAECTKGIVRMDIDILRYGDQRYHSKDWQRPYIKTLMEQL